MESLYEKLQVYCASDTYPFHMPGHKRRLGAVGEARNIDITEIDGFDNLHHAEGLLKEAQERAAALYGSLETFYLVNGSTCGILAAVFACTRQRGKLLMARNCHRAVYHAAQLRELETVYLYPRASAAAIRKSADEETKWETIPGEDIRPEDVRTALQEHRDVQAVLITSPTYEGIVSDISAIAKIVHKYGIPLIVDEAHGAHFGFHPYFPESSVKLGADIVIHSLHKTLPSLTQTALLHLNGGRISSGAVRKYLDIFQTSSPSYVLMAGMDECVCLLKEQGGRLFEAFAKRLWKFTEDTAALRHIRVLKAGNGVFAKDPSKLILQARGRSGKWLMDYLRAHARLELEMAAGSYAVALTSLADTKEGFSRLLAALLEADTALEKEAECSGPERAIQKEDPETGRWLPDEDIRTNIRVMRISEAAARSGQKRLLEESAGYVSAEYVYLYPPGIPLLVPGEKISMALIKQLAAFRAAGYSLQGMEDFSGRTIRTADGQGTGLQES